MKEGMPPRPPENRLTGQGRVPYASPRGIPMPEPGNGEGETVLPPHIRRRIEYQEKMQRAVRGEIVEEPRVNPRTEPSLNPELMDFTRSTPENREAVSNILNELQDQIVANETARQEGRREVPVDFEYADRLTKRFEEGIDQGRIKRDAATTRALRGLRGLRGELYLEMHERAGHERFGFYLERNDLRALDENAQGWLEEQYTAIYEIAQSGQEINSPMMQNMQTLVNEAMRYLRSTKPEDLALHKNFTADFTTRLNLIFMRTAVDHRDIESMGGSAKRARSEAVGRGLALDGGKVGIIFNRMNDLLEAMRLKDGGVERHVSPEMIVKLQNRVIEEQVELARSGVGPYGGLYREINRSETLTNEQKDDLVRREVLRSGRAAMDVLVSTQRLAVIASGGDFLRGGDQYRTSPGAGMPFNLEAFVVGKWNMLTPEDFEFYTEMKLDMADAHLRKMKVDPGKMDEFKREELGGRLIRNLYAVMDYYSSGWRVNAFLTQLENLCAYKLVVQEANESEENVNDFSPQVIQDRMRFMRDRAKAVSQDLGLFLRLKEAKKDDEKIVAWQKIAQYRPEEILRLFRERVAIENVATMKPADQEENAFVRLFLDNDFSHLDRVYGDEGVPTNRTELAMWRYDKMKQRYGAVLHVLREAALSGAVPKQLDVAELSQSDQEKIDRVLGPGEGRIVKQMYAKMRAFAQSDEEIVNDYMQPDNKDQKRSVINALVKDTRFVGIYTRTLVVDDLLMGELENPHAKSGITPISLVLSNEIGGDGLVRNFNDIRDGLNSQTALIKFIKTENAEERIKFAMESAEHLANANGPGARANLLRYTIGTLLKLSKKDYFWDVVGLEKLPLEFSMSKLERIYGPSAKPMGRDELRAQVMKIKNLLGMSFAIDTPEEVSLPPEERERKRQERKEAGEEVVRDLLVALDATTFDITTRKAYSLLLYLILAILGEGFLIGKSVASEGLTGKAA